MRNLEVKKCWFCGEIFKPFTNKQKFCSYACSGQSRAKATHPNLIEDYFEDINSKEKAYWLGFLFADGCVYRSGTKLQFQLRLSGTDSDQLDRFIKAVGANPSKKMIDIGERNQVGLIIRNKRFILTLEKQGCVPRKSLIIRFPVFSNESHAKAFLLGYSDGDGSASDGGAVLTCGSLQFLEGVKNYWNLSNKIKSYETFHRMCLGAVFYRELLANFPQSMPRKRKQLSRRTGKRICV